MAAKEQHPYKQGPTEKVYPRNIQLLLFILMKSKIRPPFLSSYSKTTSRNTAEPTSFQCTTQSNEQPINKCHPFCDLKAFLIKFSIISLRHSFYAAHTKYKISSLISQLILIQLSIHHHTLQALATTTRSPSKAPPETGQNDNK